MSKDGLARAQAHLERGNHRAAARLLLSVPGPEAEALLAALPPEPPHGAVLAERLRFGPPETWLAWRCDWGRVTLKHCAGGDVAARAAFRHPRVAPLLAAGPGWTAHAWIDGHSLASALGGGPAPAGTLAAVAEAIAALHAAGLAHGDLTPANIVMTEDGPVLIDWGEDCAGTPHWRPDGDDTSATRRDRFALDRLASLLRA